MKVTNTTGDGISLGDALKRAVVKALLEVPDQEMEHLRAHGSVMVNIADVVHEHIGDSTVKIVIGQTTSSDDQEPLDGRESLLGLQYLLNDWLQITGAVADPMSIDPYDHPMGGAFDKLAPRTIRTLAIISVLESDLVAIVRNEMRFRSFDLEACSA
jgi:hypothetical protein